MCMIRMTVRQIRSPIRRDHTQRETLIGLKLNKIGRVAELPDTPQTRGMIAKVAHLVRIIGQETELDCFVRAVRAEYRGLITTRIGRGEVLWAQFDAAVEACRADPNGDDRQITEKVNEMAVAKVPLDDQKITWPITYEPNLLPDERNIGHFGFLRRHIEMPEKEEFHFPIRGPRFILPPPKPLEPAAP